LFCLGVDIENTSEEGLRELLSWETCGEAKTFIYHNEAEATFHPKLYLFRNNSRAKLIVGSNNITRGGLYVNTEAGLEIESPVTEQIVRDAQTAVDGFADTSNPLTRQLNARLLEELVSLEYVYPEAVLRARRRTVAAAARERRRTVRRRLFGSRRIAAPAVPVPFEERAAESGSVLLMRVRRASATARRTQIQIPIALVRTEFFEGISALTSAHDGREHQIIRASARGGLNTYKLEVPEIDPMPDPVLRLERVENQIFYQAYNVGSILGSPIMNALRAGVAGNYTHLTKPSDPSSSTWWRFI
jgi:hypothetical protein